jgi:hypothetical protein
MSGVDRLVLMEKLKQLGWIEAPPNIDCGSLSHCCLVPPESLWLNKPKSFYVYDAIDLQNILGKMVHDEER